MKQITISAATPAQLLAFFNHFSVKFPDGTAIKRFADRKTAEKRCAVLAEKVASHFPEEAPDEGFIIDPASITAADAAALEEERLEREAEEAKKAANGHNVLNTLATTLTEMSAHAAKGNAKEKGAGSPAKPKNTPKAKATPKEGGGNREGVKKSWEDERIRGLRLTRDRVTVQAGKSAPIELESTPEGFRHFNLPMSKMIRFRLDVKEAGRQGKSATFEHNGVKYIFTILKDDEDGEASEE